MSERDRYFRIPYAPGGYAYLSRVKRSNGSGQLIAIGEDLDDTVQLNSEGTPLGMNGGIITFYLEPGIDAFQTSADILEALGARDMHDVVDLGEVALPIYAVDVSKLDEIGYRDFLREIRSGQRPTPPVRYRQIDYERARELRHKYKWIARHEHLFEDLGAVYARMTREDFGDVCCLIYETPFGRWHAIWYCTVEDDLETTYEIGFGRKGGYSSKNALLARMRRRLPGRLSGRI